MKNLCTLLVIVVLLGSCQSKQVRRNEPLPQTSTSLPRAEVLVDHKYFIISYNPEHRLPNWVAYQLSSAHLKKGVAHRRDKFFQDPQLIAQHVSSPRPDDFDGRRFDRGHMAPSEDFIWSQDANNETFVMSNMAPQTRKLNRGAWKVLESKVRKWACTEELLYVVSGPILNSQLAKMNTEISIPEKFFKVVLDQTPPKKAIAFIYSQDDGKVLPQERALSVQALEKMTGLIFFKELSLEDVETIKKHFDSSQWKETDCEQKISRRR